MKILCVCGARPNFMKIAPIMRALARTASARAVLVHTGQHYDRAMSRLFFEELGIPRPDMNLEVGSSSHALQTARVMERFEPVCLAERPDWVVVVGDVNSTLACALVAAKLCIPIAHVESGLRSFDRTMPEEINRIVTDSISRLLFVSEPGGVENLRREGITGDRVRLVGNVMIDTLLQHRARAEDSRILSRLAVETGGYAVLTLHRPGNVDETATMTSILDAVEIIAADGPIVFPMHPRSRSKLDQSGLGARVSRMRGLKVIEPLGYLDFLKLMAHARVVLTDSGGIQEETTILRVPCLTLRYNTERPITVTEGTNRLTGTATASILEGYRQACRTAVRPGQAPQLWDGNAAERIVECLLESPVSDWDATITGPMKPAFAARRMKSWPSGGYVSPPSPDVRTREPELARSEGFGRVQASQQEN
jgi:UDP-N-acetylglucosamine 2-epimerase (non-hydrolysing)